MISLQYETEAKDYNLTLRGMIHDHGNRVQTSNLRIYFRGKFDVTECFGAAEIDELACEFVSSYRSDFADEREMRGAV